MYYLLRQKKKDCSSISEPDDDFYCKEFDWGAFHPDKQSVEEACDASEDYAKNPKHCDIAYELVEKQDKNLKKDLEEACDKAGGKMEDGYCDVKQADKFYEEQVKEEQAAKEGAICDNEDADTTDIKLCMSEDRLQQAAFNIGKEECKEANGDWKKDRCTYYEDEQNHEEDVVIEDWGNTVSEEEPKREFVDQGIGNVISEVSSEEEPEQEEEEDDNSDSESEE